MSATPPKAHLVRAALYLLCAVLIFVVVADRFRPDKPQPIEYSELALMADANTVHSATVHRDGRITGQRGDLTRFEAQASPGDERIATRLMEGGASVRFARPPYEWQGIAGLLLVLALVGVLVFYMLRQNSVPGLSFGKANARVVSADHPEVTFADVAGADEAKGELQGVVAFLEDPSQFTRLGGRMPRGVILTGAPGTGKTLLARAVAGEAGRPFFSASGAEFVEMLVGVGASRVRSLFQQAIAQAPCILFIDEIDAIGKRRGESMSGSADEREQTLNQLLVEMDGFSPNTGVIVMAATNRPDVLDPALLRPGRFDTSISVEAPDRKGRRAILDVHTRDVPLADDVDLDKIAGATPGMAGADLQNVVNRAALLAARNGCAEVAHAEFEEALDRIILGLERSGIILSPAERELTAYHEAGHAIIGLSIADLDPIHKVTIVPRGRAMGVTASIPEADRHAYTQRFLEAQLAMLFGGRAAEEIVFGRNSVTTGAGNDIMRATDIARRMVCEFGMSDEVGLLAADRQSEENLGGRAVRSGISERTSERIDSEVDRLLRVAYARARNLLGRERLLLDRMAEALLDRETINRQEVEQLARQYAAGGEDAEAPATLHAC